MTNKRVHTSNSVNMDDSVLIARIEDALSLSRQHCYPKFVGFLSERQALLAKKAAKRMGGDCGILLYGGYEEAQRTLFGAFPDGFEPERESFPVIPVYMTFRRQKELTHRDFLGALMGLQIKREAVGDILVGEGRCVLFVKSEIAGFIRDNLQKVGSEGVEILENEAFPLPESRGFEEILSTVASERLDCVLAATLHLSREAACSLIRSRGVFLNEEDELSTSDRVHGGDVLSVKGYGKFIVDALGPKTKKGRLRLSIRKYK